MNAPANCSVAAPSLAVNDALPMHAPAIAGVPSYVALPAGVPSSLKRARRRRASSSSTTSAPSSDAAITAPPRTSSSFVPLTVGLCARESRGITRNAMSARAAGSARGGQGRGGREGDGEPANGASALRVPR